MTGEPRLLPLRIRLPYATEQEFISTYGGNVSASGLFIATRTPKPEGTALSFALVLADGSKLLHGEGVVDKVQDAHASRAGMFVRFVRLDDLPIQPRRLGVPSSPAVFDEYLIVHLRQRLASELPRSHSFDRRTQ